MLLTLAAGAQDTAHLPDFGSSAGAVLSPEQARAIGERMLRELRGQNGVIDDPLLADYLDSLGFSLVSESEKPDQPFTFFVVRSDQINAFAAPGGFVGVNSGLIAAAESESELAAVLAHEAAHVTQNHLVRAYERISNASLPIALAILGALIAARGGSGDAAQAAVVGGTALMQQQAINFTRHNESEADRIGMQTLANAGFQPEAMADFFARLGRVSRANGVNIPEFLRTHPLTTTRITEAKDRASAIRTERARTGLPIGAREHAQVKQATPPFLLFRERARVLGADDVRDLLSFYLAQIEAQPQHAAVYRYGLGLSHLRLDQPERAREVLTPLVRTEPQQMAFALALAQARARAGEVDEALADLSALVRDFPRNRAVTIAYADELIATGQGRNARKAISALRPLLALNDEDPLLQHAFARANELAGEEVRAGEAHAEVALLNGRFDDALQQLNALLQRADVDYYQRARIQARIEIVTPYAIEQRRRQQAGTEPKDQLRNALTR